MITHMPRYSFHCFCPLEVVGISNLLSVVDVLKVEACGSKDEEEMYPLVSALHFFELSTFCQTANL